MGLVALAASAAAVGLLPALVDALLMEEEQLERLVR